MVNQVNPMVRLVPGSPLTRAAASQPRSPQEPSPPANEPTTRPEPLKSVLASVDEEAATRAAQDLNEYLQQQTTEASKARKTATTSFADIVFQIDKSTGAAIFKVVDAKTKEVIRQVPSEEVLAMARKLRELSGRPEASGILVDEEG